MDDREKMENYAIFFIGDVYTDEVYYYRLQLLGEKQMLENCCDLSV